MEKTIVGKIANTHGVRGELKIQRTNNETFDRDVNYYIGQDFDQVEIENSRHSGELSFIKLKSFDNINDVLKYKNQFIYVDSNDLYELESDEYYVKDLVGLKVHDENNDLIGDVKDVLTYAANDIYVVSSEEGDIMIPAVKEFIKEINLEKGTIVVKVIEGM